MAKAKLSKIRTDGEESHRPGNEEDRGLLSRNSLDSDDEDHDLVIVPGRTASFEEAEDDHKKQQQQQQQPRTPRTPNRVRFDLPPEPNDSACEDSPPPLLSGRRDSRPQSRVPLLTDIEAPSITLATSPWLDRRSDNNNTTNNNNHHHGEEGYEEEEEDVQAWAEHERARPKSGLRSAFMNMANSIIGAGIIGQPYAFRQAGLLTGVILLVGLTITVDWTIRLIVINSKLSGSNSFQGTVQHCFGKAGLIAISVAQWAFAFGGMVAFGIIVGDSIPHVLAAVWPGLGDVPVLKLLVDRRGVIVVFILGISWPLSLYRDIAKLAKASTLALVSMLVILFTVIVKGVQVPAESRGTFSTPLWTINSGVFQAIGVISFAFVCHHNSLLIYGSLKTPTIDRFARVTHYSTTISMLACLLMALSGFLTFGSVTEGNVLNNFPADSIMVNIARFCFGLNMLTTLPLEAFVCREVMVNYFLPGGQKTSTALHFGISTSLVVGAMLLSLTTCDLGAVFELIGATSACALAYVLPPLCYIKLSTRSWKTVPAVACVMFGVAVICISLVQAVVKMLSTSGEAKVCR